MSNFEEGKRKELGLPSKKEILDQGLRNDKINPENFDYRNPYVGKTYNAATGQYISKWELIKSTAETPEEYKEQFLDYDLKDLKKEQVRRNSKDGKFYNGWGEEHKNANKNFKIRKQVTEVLKKAGITDPIEVDRVMFAKDWDSYKVKRDNRKKPFESTLDNVVNQRTPSETNFDNIDAIINSSREFRQNILQNKINEVLRLPQTLQVNQVEPKEPMFSLRKKEGIESLMERSKELPSRSGGLSYLLGVNDE